MQSPFWDDRPPATTLSLRSRVSPTTWSNSRACAVGVIRPNRVLFRPYAVGERSASFNRGVVEDSPGGAQITIRADVRTGGRREAVCVADPLARVYVG